MSEQKFLLMNSKAHSCHVAITSGAGGSAITLSEETRHHFDVHETATLLWFLDAVKGGPGHRHTYTDEHFVLDYEPDGADLHKFVIVHRATGREITMGYSTAWRLLDALTGKTERLIVDE